VPKAGIDWFLGLMVRCSEGMWARLGTSVRFGEGLIMGSVVVKA